MQIGPELWLFAAALGTSLLGGVLGMASGIFIVPILTMFGRIDIRTAIGASLISVIACSCGSAASFLKQRLTINDAGGLRHQSFRARTLITQDELSDQLEQQLGRLLHYGTLAAAAVVAAGPAIAFASGALGMPIATAGIALFIIFLSFFIGVR